MSAHAAAFAKDIAIRHYAEQAKPRALEQPRDRRHFAVLETSDLLFQDNRDFFVSVPA